MQAGRRYIFIILAINRHLDFDLGTILFLNHESSMRSNVTDKLESENWTLSKQTNLGLTELASFCDQLVNGSQTMNEKQTWLLTISGMTGSFVWNIPYELVWICKFRSLQIWCLQLFSPFCHFHFWCPIHTCSGVSINLHRYKFLRFYWERKPSGIRPRSHFNYF